MAHAYAAFDIDGTIIRWQLYHAIADAFARQGFIDAADFAQVRSARMNWKKRAHSDGFKIYERALVTVFDAALTKLTVKEFEAVTTDVFEQYKDQVYCYTRDLILALQSKQYLLFAISGSPSTIVKLFAAYYGFTDYAATEYPAVDGHFTGEKQLSLGRKAELLEQMITKHNAQFKGSIVVGDSESDIDMLSLAESPIAFNPSSGLFSHAKQQRWKIVIERKNMVYELEPGDGSYILA